MATKTLTITEDAYNLLAYQKQEEESFSQEITRLFSQRKKHTLKDLFGLIPDDVGRKMLAELDAHKKMEVAMLKKRLG